MSVHCPQAGPHCSSNRQRPGTESCTAESRYQGQILAGADISCGLGTGCGVPILIPIEILIVEVNLVPL